MTDSGAARVPPRPQEHWDDDVRSAIHTAFPGEVGEHFLSTGALPNAIATFLHHPALAGRWLSYNNVLLWEGTLDARLRELVVLRVAWICRSRYEWAQHVRLAGRFNVVAADLEDLLDDGAVLANELSRSAVDGGVVRRGSGLHAQLAHRVGVGGAGDAAHLGVELHAGGPAGQAQAL